MRIHLAIVAVALGCLCASVVSADDSYLCVGTHATGFGYHDESKTWGVERFPPTKLIVKRKESLIVGWQVFDYEKNVPIANCRGDFDDDGLLGCEGVAEFRMSREKMRFLYIYTLGYWSDSDKYPAYMEGTNRPWMEIGTCSRF